MISYLNANSYYYKALYRDFTDPNPGSGRRREIGFFLFQATAVDILKGAHLLQRVLFLM